MTRCKAPTHDENKSPRYDARGIFLAYVCPACVAERMAGYRADVMTDPDYWHDEPIDED
jgi:hypothetical protein